MLNKLKSIAAALPLILLAATPSAQAVQYGGSYYNPDGSGGCNPASYNEDWGNVNEWWTWDVPSIGNGQSVTVNNSVYNSNTYTYTSPENNHNAYPITFTCNDGYISGDYVASFGMWM